MIDYRPRHNYLDDFSCFSLHWRAAIDQQAIQAGVNTTIRLNELSRQLLTRSNFNSFWSSMMQK